MAPPPAPKKPGQEPKETPKSRPMFCQGHGVGRRPPSTPASTPSRQSATPTTPATPARLTRSSSRQNRTAEQSTPTPSPALTPTRPGVLERAWAARGGHRLRNRTPAGLTAAAPATPARTRNSNQDGQAVRYPIVIQDGRDDGPPAAAPAAPATAAVPSVPTARGRARRALASHASASPVGPSASPAPSAGRVPVPDPAGVPAPGPTPSPVPGPAPGPAPSPAAAPPLASAAGAFPAPAFHWPGTWSAPRDHGIPLPHNIYNGLDNIMRTQGVVNEADFTWMNGIQYGIGLGIMAYRDSLLTEIETEGRVFGRRLEPINPFYNHSNTMTRHMIERESIEYFDRLQAYRASELYQIDSARVGERLLREGLEAVAGQNNVDGGVPLHIPVMQPAAAAPVGAQLPGNMNFNAQQASNFNAQQPQNNADAGGYQFHNPYQHVQIPAGIPVIGNPEDLHFSDQELAAIAGNVNGRGGQQGNNAGENIEESD